jgi:hypothetical protein
VGKFGYELPQEKGKQSSFVADVWANFAPAAAYEGIGLPDPRLLNWPL